MKSIIAALIMATFALGAPALKDKPGKAPPRVVAGSWSLSWEGQPWEMSLTEKGVYSATSTSGSEWWGTWHFDGESNRFSIQETQDGLTWWAYTWEIDQDGAGKCVFRSTNGVPGEHEFGPKIKLKLAK